MTRLGVEAALVEGRWVVGDVAVADGRIEAVGLGGPPTGRRAAPGFVDLQVNGVGTQDLTRPTPTAATVDAVASELAAHGVTAFLPTLCSGSLEEYVDALEVIGSAARRSGAGARPLGTHLEGPFLAPAWAGAHDAATLEPPRVEVVDRLLGAGGALSMMTLAPELPGALEVIAHLRRHGVVAAMGHTDATAAEAHRAVDAGVALMTHCHNAHRRWAPRDPGPAGVAVARPDVVVGVIGDLVHLAPETVAGLFAAAPGRVALVSDLVAAGADDGRLGRVDATGVPRGPGGVLAGSATPLDEVLRRLVGIGLDPAEVLGAMSTVPARVLGRPAGLTPGSPADVVVLDDSWEVVATMVGPSTPRG